MTYWLARVTHTLTAIKKKKKGEKKRKLSVCWDRVGRSYFVFRKMPRGS